LKTPQNHAFPIVFIIKGWMLTDDHESGHAPARTALWIADGFESPLPVMDIDSSAARLTCCLDRLMQALPHQTLPVAFDNAGDTGQWQCRTYNTGGTTLTPQWYGVIELSFATPMPEDDWMESMGTLADGLAEKSGYPFSWIEENVALIWERPIQQPWGSQMARDSFFEDQSRLRGAIVRAQRAGLEASLPKGADARPAVRL
jgi:hypothetical protein